jgi:hypothetical protein
MSQKTEDPLTGFDSLVTMFVERLTSVGGPHNLFGWKRISNASQAKASGVPKANI